MRSKAEALVIGACALLGLAGAGGAAAQDHPAGVTDSTIAAGQEVYAGRGQCVKCHGDEGQGTAEATALDSGQWKLTDGSYEGLLLVIRHSGISAAGRDGDPLPMRGPTLLQPGEVRAVAAYVWSISRARAPKPD